MPIRKLTIAAVGILLLTGCASDTHESAQVTDVNHGPARTIDFPEGFRNMAAKCDGPNMVYSVSSARSDSLSGGVAVVANDPRCGGNG